MKLKWGIAILADAAFGMTNILQQNTTWVAVPASHTHMKHQKQRTCQLSSSDTDFLGYLTDFSIIDPDISMSTGSAPAKAQKVDPSTTKTIGVNLHLFEYIAFLVNSLCTGLLA
ncbi:hypothetical protein HPP92_028838 [Vanilla planifolia]|uniref:Uncharacterized protein n=1 Tax=Vanilla planifolia TaxID=51239 RepID=A0A835P5Y1_VANPL|nr:hypothetical protein HPP92_028838 [Vanilla planifolia]KAG0446460.1 hypothetical protein HPP92_028827 [Vanilla planifolia]